MKASEKYAQPTCEQRIDTHLHGRICDLNEMTEKMAAAYNTDDDAYDEAQEELDNFALCIDIKSTMVVQISTGGPGDQFEIDIVNNGHGWELADTEATYRFLDWFDGATRRTDDPTVMEYLRNTVERLSY